MDSMTAASRIGGIGEGGETKTVSAGTQPNRKCFSLRSEDRFEKLFPRLPNEITLCRIVPKLPWRAVHILAAVSRAWRNAIQSHRVYDARIRSCSTDTLVVHAHTYNPAGEIARIAVYSVREKLCYDLPPIPGHSRGIPSSCECVSLDSKIYVLGGVVDESSSSRSSSKVYVLDLAGPSHWKECASMERGRQQFGCGVIDGKIYAFGGTHDCRPVRGAEVYKPKVNAWFPIMPMPSLRYYHKACTFAGKIIVHGGQCYDVDYIHGHRNSWVASSLEKYHPGEDEWTRDQLFPEIDEDLGPASIMFMAEGKFHVMHDHAVYVNEDSPDIRSWRLLKADSFPRMGPDWIQDPIIVTPNATVVVNDELVAGVNWDVDSGDGLDESNSSGSSLLQSTGFGTENSKIVWKVVSNCPATFHFMHCIQL